MKKSVVLLLSLMVASFVSAATQSTTLEVPETFSSKTTAESGEVNTNFSILYTDYILPVGGDKIEITSEEQGAIMYYSGSAWTVLTPGTDGQFLETNGTSNNPSWSSAAGSQITGTFTRDISLTGTQAITGVGFQPSVVWFYSVVSNSAGVSFGVDDGTTAGAVNNAHDSSADTWNQNADSGIWIVTGISVYSHASITTLGTDGFTLTWAKSGSPTGTVTVFYAAVN